MRVVSLLTFGRLKDVLNKSLKVKNCRRNLPSHYEESDCNLTIKIDQSSRNFKIHFTFLDIRFIPWKEQELITFIQKSLLYH